MKSIIPIISIILFILALTSSYFMLYKTKVKITKYENIVSQLSSCSENYLASLLTTSEDLSKVNVNVLGNNECALYDLCNTNLCYYFSPNDCETCIEENIFELVKMIRNKELSKVIIISKEDKLRYLKLLERTHREEDIIFATTDSMCLKKSCYFLFDKNCHKSNFYYPVKGEFGFTLLYLEAVCKKVNGNS